MGSLLLLTHSPQVEGRTKFRYPMGKGGTYVTAYYDNDRGAGIRDWNNKKKTYNKKESSVVKSKRQFCIGFFLIGNMIFTPSI